MYVWFLDNDPINDKRQWRSRCQFGVWSHPLDFPSMWTTAHGVGPRCGRSLSCVYTGCLVIKSPYGVVSVTSYTLRSQSVWEWGGDPLSEPYRIAVVMTFRGPPHDTIKILSLLPTVMDSMENLCRSEARYLMNELEIIVTIQFFWFEIFTCQFASTNLDVILVRAVLEIIIPTRPR